ncbi:hypothetical protein AVR82_17370 (plasmid) [Lactiplantibacillus plantarum]|nr:hypothetical protein AVR82_17370 [Lactiplantibacillus plantarum]AOB24743.1 hypothetical protein AVR83_17525 [Lactiplantibacillus plantarum]
MALVLRTLTLKEISIFSDAQLVLFLVTAIFLDNGFVKDRPKIISSYLNEKVELSDSVEKIQQYILQMKKLKVFNLNFLF